MKDWLIWLFGCRCKRLGFPIARRKQQGGGWKRLTGIYVVCLDCGAEYPYDWQNMRRMEPPKSKGVRPQTLPLINADEIEY